MAQTRITDADLKNLCNRINKLTGSPIEQYTFWDDGHYHSNIGNYYISGAYGGVKLERIVNDGGGCQDISHNGFGTKRELYTWMDAFLRGLESRSV